MQKNSNYKDFLFYYFKNIPSGARAEEAYMYFLVRIPTSKKIIIKKRKNQTKKAFSPRPRFVFVENFDRL